MATVRPSPAGGDALAKPLDFYFDFVSPFAYLANVQLPAIARRHGRVLNYLPVDVANAKQAAGNNAPSTRSMPPKAKFIRRDRLQWAAQYGVPMNDPPAFRAPRLNAGVLYALDRDCAAAYVDAAFHRVWGRGEDPDGEDTLRGVALQLGLDAAHFLGYLGSPEAAARYRAVEREAWERGVFGVPMVAADGELFWGNDRLDFLEEHLRRCAADILE